MNELDAAQQVRAGTSPSGSAFGNAWLFALRISGTGMAARPALSELVYRDPAIWTCEQMLSRANGLPVVMGHPAGGVLNSDEFAGRVIGAIVLPYVAGSELWGIARVMDENAASLMASGKFSTSPGVMVPTAEIEGDGGTLVIEKDPVLLDHVAIVPNNGEAGGGVWDKSGPGTGIRADSIHSERTKPMAEETAKPSDGEKLDKLLAGLGGLTTMCQSMAARLDALEKRGDGARKDGVAEKKDGVAEKKDGVAVKKDGAADMPGTMPGAPMPAAADAATPAERNEAERKEAEEKANVQARADSVMSRFGEQAPPPMAGERQLDYRVRLARQLQRYL
jgi:hypothetical protein